MNEKIIASLCAVSMALMLVSCSNEQGYKRKLNVPCSRLEPREIEILEYNKALFSIDTADFTTGIERIKIQYHDLLGDVISDTDVEYLKEFVTDPFIIRLNDLVLSEYADITLVKNKVRDVLQHLTYYYPDIKLPKVYTYVSGVDYNNGPVMINDSIVLISLDYYLNNKENVYDNIGMPRYISRRCQIATLTKDLAEAIYNAFLYEEKTSKNVLSEMIAVGKKYYFIEAMDPSLSDSIILGYSSRQMDWVRNSEGELWASVIGNNMLYANGYEQRRLLFNDGPFTAAFSDKSPSRLGDFIGLQIIRSFMTNNDVSLNELMAMTDVQDIFQRSKYKPPKR
ncbi:MAG: hypothetical protein ACI358_03065 [Candidatus Limimorpha sp.]